jgi:hypothetical protein
MTDDSNALADELDARLANADAALAAAYPGDRGRRQPVHTVYVPADRYDSGTVRGWAEEAKRAAAGPRRSWPKRWTCGPASPSRSTSGYAEVGLRGGRGSAHRLRGRLRHPARR